VDSDGVGRFHFHQGGYEDSDEDMGVGTWSIADGVLTFAADWESWESRAGFSLSGKTAKLWISESSLRSIYYLEIEPDQLLIWNRSIDVAPQMRRVWRGFEVVSIGQDGFTNNAVKVRGGPGTSYDPVELEKYSEIFIPEGEPVRVRARTLEKDPVGSWLNYWYLISVELFHYMGSSYQFVWAYGEFIDIGGEVSERTWVVPEYIKNARPRG